MATYGQVARLAGIPQHARQVGYALNALKDERVPWQRVINAKGEISRRAMTYYEKKQRTLLKKEGIVFRGETIPLTRFQWRKK